MPSRACSHCSRICKVIHVNRIQGANEEAQEKADETFAEFESSILQDINDFSGVVNVNSKSVAAAQADLDAIE
jgi:hypothetical protein